MTVWNRLAALLGVRDDQVDDALADERRARIQLDRRGFLLAGSALAAGPLLPKAAWSFPAPFDCELIFDMKGAWLELPNETIVRLIGGMAIVGQRSYVDQYTQQIHLFVRGYPKHIVTDVRIEE